MSAPVILICDDSILARKQLSDVVKSTFDDVEILEAANGKIGVELFNEKKPDLTFIDLTMPVMDGTTAIAEMTKERPDANIIVVSSIGTKNELRKSIEAGARDFIQKPFSEKQITLLLESYFKED